MLKHLPEPRRVIADGSPDGVSDAQNFTSVSHSSGERFLGHPLSLGSPVAFCRLSERGVKARARWLSALGAQRASSTSGLGSPSLSAPRQMIVS
jgi:hypothetical protein